jgi:hypothetical protein
MAAGSLGLHVSAWGYSVIVQQQQQCCILSLDLGHNLRIAGVMHNYITAQLSPKIPCGNSDTDY